MNNQQHHTSDEIGLFELLSALWQKKIKIILVTLLFMLLAFVYALNTTTSWSVSAIIDTPTAGQVKQYNLNRELINEGIKTLNRNLELKNKVDQVLTIENRKYNELPTIETLHSQFISEARMTTNQIEFFKSQSLFKTTVAKEQLGLVEQNSYARRWVNENISFTAENKNRVNFNNEIGTNITITATKSEDALTLNNAYLNFINHIMMERTRELIVSELSVGLQQMESFSENKVNAEKYLLKKKIYDIDNNIKIAKQANIKNFVTQKISLLSAPEYAKGYEILAAEKFVLAKKLTDYNNGEIIDSNTLLVKKWREFDKNMKLDDFNFYRFTDKPNLPKNSDNPNTALIIVLGSLLGFMLSSIYFLLMCTVNYKRIKVG